MINDPFWRWPIPWSDLSPRFYLLLLGVVTVTTVLPRILWTWGWPGWMLVVLCTAVVMPFVTGPSLARAAWLLLAAMVIAMLTLPFATMHLTLGEVLSFDVRLHGKDIMGLVYLYAIVLSAFTSALGWVFGFGRHTAN